MSPHEQTHLGTVFLGEIPDSTPHRFWVEILKDIMVMVVRMFLYYMLLSAASFLFWAPAMMSENLSHAANFRSTNLKTQHRNRPQKYEIKTSTYQNISKYYDYKVLVFLLCSHTHLTSLSWSLANSQASGRTPMSQQGRNAAWISVCRYQQH